MPEWDAGQREAYLAPYDSWHHRIAVKPVHQNGIQCRAFEEHIGLTVR